MSRSLGLSPGPLGLALFAGALASMLAMALLGWTADLLGRRAFVAAASVAFAAGVAGLSLARGYAAFLAALVLLYAGSGLYDVGVNAVAVDLERALRRRVMSLLHAAFSGGGVLGALSAGALLSAGAGYRLVYLLTLPPLGVAAAALCLARLPEAEEGRGKKEGGGAPLYRNGPLLLVAAIATLGLLSEGEMEHWSGIYLRQTLGFSALLGGSGVAVFYGAMALGRLAGAPLVLRYGNRRALLGAGLLSALGMLLSLLGTWPPLVVGGFLVVGLALSAVVPVAFSLAGELSPGRAGAGISVVTTLGYGGFLVGPVIVGGLAELLGLRAALGVIAAAGLLIFALALRLGRPAPP
ncbi:Twin-arginine translocation pathway signal [Rubrobacter xylanophilus DSM 9941]|uniref:Twin-arginine translocation pathway signal n=1 Tax=Rubrobacter xylanophilus (strain DSM 9941 / JCM 11954 / NBRC 16129 / PRD-1) TaxID=266117 RepID=Q1AST0_RUBXD|nr:Twin-arginine translocation pathway signal [Rubrobacter xylanophilus DSM 9941]